MRDIQDRLTDGQSAMRNAASYSEGGITIITSRCIHKVRGKGADTNWLTSIPAAYATVVRGIRTRTQSA